MLATRKWFYFCIVSIICLSLITLFSGCFGSEDEEADIIKDIIGSDNQNNNNSSQGSSIYVNGFAGAWQSDWGILIFSIEGTKVRGIYEHDDGRIEATLSNDGKTMEGTWGEAPSYLPTNDGGRVIFKLSDDGNSITGHWWYGNDIEGGDWNGRRIQGITKPNDQQVTYVKGFEGTWQTDWGQLVFKADGIKIKGTYEHDNGVINAILSNDGKTMEGTWGEAPSYLPPDDGGRVIFTLSDDKNEIKGHWWYGHDEEGGDWNGKRIK